MNTIWSHMPSYIKHLNHPLRLIKPRHTLCTKQNAYSRFNVFICKNSLTKTSNCSFHTSKACSAPIFPLLMMILKPISKGLAIISGRTVRKWWQSLPPNKKQYFMESARRNRFKIAGFMVFISGTSVIYYYTHIQETPITKRKRFISFTQDQFEQIADFQFKMQLEMHKSDLLPSQHPSCKRVENVANKLLISNKNIEMIHGKHWSISVINDDIQNAYVLPNGQIFVFTGMLNLCENNDQLGVILGHEMAHCILGHAAEALSFTHLVDIVVITVLAAIWMILPSDGIAIVTHWFFNKVVDILLHLPYNRKLEVEADEVGLQLAAKACFDVRESSAFWNRMNIVKQSPELDIEWLSTHPTNENRSNFLDEIMDQAIELRKSCGCPPLSKKDPRSNIAVFKKLIEDTNRNELGYTKLSLTR